MCPDAKVEFTPHNTQGAIHSLNTDHRYSQLVQGLLPQPQAQAPPAMGLRAGGVGVLPDHRYSQLVQGLLPQPQAQAPPAMGLRAGGVGVLPPAPPEVVLANHTEDADHTAAAFIKDWGAVLSQNALLVHEATQLGEEQVKAAVFSLRKKENYGAWAGFAQFEDLLLRAWRQGNAAMVLEHVAGGETTVALLSICRQWAQEECVASEPAGTCTPSVASDHSTIVSTSSLANTPVVREKATSNAESAASAAAMDAPAILAAVAGEATLADNVGAARMPDSGSSLLQQILDSQRAMLNSFNKLAQSLTSSSNAAAAVAHATQNNQGLKAPSNAFQLWAKSIRRDENAYASIKAVATDRSAKGLTKVMAEKWASLSDDDKQPYVAEASRLLQAWKAAKRATI